MPNDAGGGTGVAVGEADRVAEADLALVADGAEDDADDAEDSEPWGAVAAVPAAGVSEVDEVEPQAVAPIDRAMAIATSA